MLQIPSTRIAAKAAPHIPCNNRCTLSTHLLSKSRSTSSSSSSICRTSTALIWHHSSFSRRSRHFNTACSTPGPHQQPSSCHSLRLEGRGWEEHSLEPQQQPAEQQPPGSTSSNLQPNVVAASALQGAEQAPAVTSTAQPEAASDVNITTVSPFTITSSSSSVQQQQQQPCSTSHTFYRLATAAHRAVHNSSIGAHRRIHLAAQTREHLNTVREENAQQLSRKAATFANELRDSAKETARELGPPATAAATKLIGKKNAAAAVQLLGKSNTAVAVGQLGASNTAAATEQLGVSGTAKVTERLGPVGVMKVLRKLGPEGVAKLSIKLSPAMARGVRRGADNAAAAVGAFLRAEPAAKCDLLKSTCGSCVWLLGACGMLVLASAARVLLVGFAAAASWVSSAVKHSTAATHSPGDTTSGSAGYSTGQQELPNLRQC